jgi:CCCH zinc finger in TRM13 protein
MGDGVSCEVRAAKLCRNTDMSCSYWLTKRNRYCLTKPIPGQIYCEVHLEFSEKLNAEINSRTDDTLHNVESGDKINRQCSVTEKNAVLPTDGRCNFWLAKKRRFCKLFAAPDRQYCVEHSVTSSVRFFSDYGVSSIFITN